MPVPVCVELVPDHLLGDGLGPGHRLGAGRPETPHAHGPVLHRQQPRVRVRGPGLRGLRVRVLGRVPGVDPVLELSTGLREIQFGQERSLNPTIGKDFDVQDKYLKCLLIVFKSLFSIVSYDSELWKRQQAFNNNKGGTRTYKE